MGKKNPLFTGVATALVTPFMNDGTLDEVALRRLVEHQIDNGINALVPCGSTGEAATLTHEEQARVIRIVAETTRGRVPVIAGTGSNSTTEAIALTRAAFEAGAKGALLISPYYVKPMQNGIVAHYREVAKAVPGFPLIVYNIPGRTGSKIEASTMQELADIPEVVGLKDATGSLDETMGVLAACGRNFPVYAGDDALTVPIMAVGGVGVISVISNILPGALVSMVEHLERGNVTRARAELYHLLPLMKALFLETNPIPIKAALAMMGFCTDQVRLPLTPMTEGPRQKLGEALTTLGVLERRPSN